MINAKTLMLIASLTVSCGTSEEEAKEELNENTITLTPPPGEYAYVPWVVMKKKDDGIGSGVIYAKTPGDTEFASASGCSSAPFAASAANEWASCVQIKETGKLEYYLLNTAAQGETKGADYVINLPKQSFEISSRETDAGEKIKIPADEVSTRCKVSRGDSGVELAVMIKFQNDEKLGDRFGYLAFEMKDPAANQTTTVNHENTSLSAGIGYKPKSEEFSEYFSSFDFQYMTTNEGVEGIQPGFCSITVKELDLGKVTKGTVTCVNLRNWLSDPEADKKKLGRIVDVTADWTCDSY